MSFVEVKLKSQIVVVFLPVFWMRPSPLGTQLACTSREDNGGKMIEV
jgi:hypothetical protein